MIYQLKITLRDSKPSIWRRVLVPVDILLPDLHKIIQTTMGWYNCHLHQFIVGRTMFGAPDPEGMMEISDYSKVKLGEVLFFPGKKITYEYDLGDSWEHNVLLEKILPDDPKSHYPICLTGRRACPPEDSGSWRGYEDKLRIMADPEDPDHDEIKEWIGEDFDPESFDLDEINQALKTEDFGCLSL